MKRIVMICLLSVVAMGLWAVPAKRIRKTLTLADGSQIEATLHGDEYQHYYLSDDGRMWCRQKGDIFVEANADRVRARHREKMARSNARRIKRRARWGAESNPISGSKKGLVILVNFPDKKLSFSQSEFNDFFNKVGYNNFDIEGSVHDYFYAQSYGTFDLTFDVIGPVLVEKSYKFYGEDIVGADPGEDMYPGTMVAEACKLADPLVNYANYDWDGDGEVEQVYVVYAGNGQSQSDDPYTVWPHEFSLFEAYEYGDGEGPLSMDGVIIDTYACSSELCSDTEAIIDGIGTACHEFSHCMCIPDMYDINGKAFGMDSWDLLDYGCYNGKKEQGECPAAYTSYERMYCGWLTPTELKTDCEIKDMSPLTSVPEAYIIYNDANRNEYYLLENRQLEGYDAWGYGHGMLVIHVDYDSLAWMNNEVNAQRNHQRMTIIPADNQLSTALSSMAGDPWPGTSNKTELSDESTPAATLFNPNKDGRLFMGKSIKNITETNGLISFVFDDGQQLPAPVASEEIQQEGTNVTVSWSAVEGAILYELELTETDATSQSPDDNILISESFEYFRNNLTSDSPTDISGKLDEYTEEPGWTGSKLYTTPNTEVKMGTKSATGSLVSPQLDAPENGAVTVLVTCRRYSSDTGQVVVKVNDTIIGTITPKEYVDSYVFSVDCDQPFNVTIETTTKRAYLMGVTVYDGTYSDGELIMRAPAVRRIKQYYSNTTADTKYTFENLSTEKKYAFKVRALTEDQTSKWSNTVRFTLDAMGVEGVKVSEQGSGEMFDLTGRRVINPQRGIYIQKGRKVLY